MKKPRRPPTGYNRRRNAERRARNSPLHKAFAKSKLSKQTMRAVLVHGWGDRLIGVELCCARASDSS